MLTKIESDRIAHEQTIEIAREQANDELEIDDWPVVAIEKDGIWVSAWIWVPVEEDEPQLEWLILPDEKVALYTNWGDGREGDASQLVNKVNSDPALNLGKDDWRLPKIDELESIIDSKDAPDNGFYWSSDSWNGSTDYAWYACFPPDRVVDNGHRENRGNVRLVRSKQ